MVKFKTDDSDRVLVILESDLIVVSNKVASQLLSIPAKDIGNEDFTVEDEDWETISIYTH